MKKCFLLFASLFFILTSCSNLLEPNKKTSLKVSFPEKSVRAVYGTDDIGSFAVKLLSEDGLVVDEVSGVTKSAEFNEITAGNYKVIAQAFAEDGETVVAHGETDFFTVKAGKQTSVSVTLFMGEYADMTSFRVKFFFEALNSSDYEENETLTQEFYCNAGELTSVEAPEYTGFTVRDFTQQQVQADGSTVIEIYYQRNVYSIKYLFDGELYGEKVELKYGQTIQPELFVYKNNLEYDDSQKEIGRIEPKLENESWYFFSAWCSDPECKEFFDFDAYAEKELVIEDDINIYGKWLSQDEAYHFAKNSFAGDAVLEVYADDNGNPILKENLLQKYLEHEFYYPYFENPSVLFPSQGHMSSVFNQNDFSDEKKSGDSISTDIVNSYWGVTTGCGDWYAPSLNEKLRFDQDIFVRFEYLVQIDEIEYIFKSNVTHLSAVKKDHTDFDDFYEKIQKGSSYILEKTIEIPISINIDWSVVIEGTGSSAVLKVSDGYYGEDGLFYVGESGELTLKNLTIEGNPEFIFKDLLIFTSGKVTLENVTFKNINNTYWRPGFVLIEAMGQAQFSNVKFENCSTTNQEGISCFIYNEGSCEITDLIIDEITDSSVAINSSGILKIGGNLAFNRILLCPPDGPDDSDYFSFEKISPITLSAGKKIKLSVLWYPLPLDYLFKYTDTYDQNPADYFEFTVNQIGYTTNPFVYYMFKPDSTDGSIIYLTSASFSMDESSETVRDYYFDGFSVKSEIPGGYSFTLNSVNYEKTENSLIEFSSVNYWVTGVADSQSVTNTVNGAAKKILIKDNAYPVEGASINPLFTVEGGILNLSNVEFEDGYTNIPVYLRDDEDSKNIGILNLEDVIFGKSGSDTACIYMNKNTTVTISGNSSVGSIKLNSGTNQTILVESDVVPGDKCKIIISKDVVLIDQVQTEYQLITYDGDATAYFELESDSDYKLSADGKISLK